MKIKILLLFHFFFSSMSLPKVWHVDQNTANHADYTNLQAAIDAAQVQDTIYVVGHPANYGSANISKYLVLIGAGYFLQENSGMQAYPFSSQITQVQFFAGSANAVVCGFEITSGVMMGSDNVTLSRNNIWAISNYYWGANAILWTGGNHNNCIIECNFISGFNCLTL